jgi:hypothetical protein
VGGDRSPMRLELRPEGFVPGSRAHRTD